MLPEVIFKSWPVINVPEELLKFLLIKLKSFKT